MLSEPSDEPSSGLLAPRARMGPGVLEGSCKCFCFRFSFQEALLPPSLVPAWMGFEGCGEQESLSACLQYRLPVLLGAGSWRGWGDLAGFSWGSSFSCCSLSLGQALCTLASWVGVSQMFLVSGGLDGIFFSTSVHWACWDWFEHCWERTLQSYWHFFGKTSVLCRVIFEDCSFDSIPCWTAL